MHDDSISDLQAVVADVALGVSSPVALYEHKRAVPHAEPEPRPLAKHNADQESQPFATTSESSGSETPGWMRRNQTESSALNLAVVHPPQRLQSPTREPTGRIERVVTSGDVRAVVTKWRFKNQGVVVGVPTCGCKRGAVLGTSVHLDRSTLRLLLGGISINALAIVARVWIVPALSAENN